MKKNTIYYRPSAVAQETRAMQPILFSLMWKICDILGGCAHLTKEQFLPKQVEKSRRWMDAMCADMAHDHLRFADGCLMGNSIEIKPNSRKGKTFPKITEAGSNQVLGRNLQHLFDARLQYCGGLGRVSKSSGLVLTMILARILSHSLEGIGNTNAGLCACFTPDQPLFSRRTTENLFMEAGDDVTKLLAFDDLGTDDLPSGFRALVHFLLSVSPNETFFASPADVKIGTKRFPITIREFLGSGSFSSVHGCVLKEEDNTTEIVVKIAKSPRSVGVLEHELETLKNLSHDAIPKLFKHELADLLVQERCERNIVKCVMLRLEQGLCANDFCETNPVKIERVFRVVKEALDYAHGEGWCHMDVKPSNVIVIPPEMGRPAEQADVRLIDWGCAARTAKTLDHYQGTPPFSNPELLRVNSKRKWEKMAPKSEFDLYSLTMTVCYLQYGRMPWDGFNGVYVTQANMDNWAKLAKSSIEESRIDDEVKRDLIDIIETNTPRRSECLAAGTQEAMQQERCFQVEGREETSKKRREGATPAKELKRVRRDNWEGKWS